jgi:hypothetical protein
VLCGANKASSSQQDSAGLLLLAMKQQLQACCNPGKVPAKPANE